MQQPIEQMLLPDEKIRFRARVHWVEVLHRGFWLWIALLSAWGFWHMQHNKGPLVAHARWLGEGTLKNFFLWLHRWFTDIPDVIHGVIIIMATIGIWRTAHAIIDMFYTQLVITDWRILLRRGVYSIDIIELDRRRIASIGIHQSFYGRIFHYGYIYILGFGTSIYGLPALAKPHLIQQHIHS